MGWSYECINNESMMNQQNMWKFETSHISAFIIFEQKQQRTRSVETLVITDKRKTTNPTTFKMYWEEITCFDKFVLLESLTITGNPHYDLWCNFSNSFKKLKSPKICSVCYLDAKFLVKLLCGFGTGQLLFYVSSL